MQTLALIFDLTADAGEKCMLKSDNGISATVSKIIIIVHLWHRAITEYTEGRIFEDLCR